MNVQVRACDGLLAPYKRDKCKRVLPPKSDLGAARFYERLLDIAERFRNTHVHGGFDKDHGDLAVHCAGGALVADLAQREGKPYYEIIPVDEGDFGHICGVFDEFDLWLGSNYGYRWAEAGLSVAFDRQSIRCYREAMVSDENFECYLDQMTCYEDDLANMDW